MNKILKLMATSTILAATLSANILSSDFSFENITADQIGIHLGAGKSDFTKSDIEGTLTNWNEPSSSLLGAEVFSTFNNVFEEKTVKPFLSYTYLSNSDISNEYVLVGINKYFLDDDLTYYAGAYTGWGMLQWKTNPIIEATQDNQNTSSSMIFGLQAGTQYKLNKRFSLDINLKTMIHKHSTILNVSSEVSSEIEHPSTTFVGIGLVYSFGYVKP